MRQFHDTVTKEVKELTTTPGPLIIKTLIENSLSNDFEEAKKEWELIGPITRDSEEFVSNCELCNSHLQKENWIIFNPNSLATLKIGSECIRRFILLAGTSSHEDSITFFEIRSKEFKTEMDLIELYPEAVKDPLPTRRNINTFRKKLLALLESKGQAYTSDQDIEFILTSLLRKTKASGKEKFRLFEILNQPEKITYQPENKKWREYKLKEGDTWKKKNKVTGGTLVSSKIYRDPSKKYD